MCHAEFRSLGRIAGNDNALSVILHGGLDYKSFIAETIQFQGFSKKLSAQLLCR